MNTNEIPSFSLDISMSADQVHALEWGIFAFFIAAIPALIVKQLYRGKGQVKGRILGRVNQRLEHKMPF